MNRNLAIILYFMFILNCTGQKDSINKSLVKDFWTPRYSIGLQKAPFIEIGFSKLRFLNDFEGGSQCFYSAIEINNRNSPSDSKFYYSLKCGFETSWMIGMWAMELKYLTDFEKSQLVFTPKVGLSFEGFINILYGYNFPEKFSNLYGLGHHQIALVININRRIIKEFRTNSP
jgi:hypothetical protein